MPIIGRSDLGKTKLLFKFLLKNYFDFEKVVFASPSLTQAEYEVIIKSLQKGLSINQIRTIFEVQKHITNIDSALDIITSNENFKPTKLEVIEFKSPDYIPLPNELIPRKFKRVLVVIDDCTIINSVNPIQLFVYGWPLNINTIYLSQKYTKVPCTITENCNVFVVFNQNTRTIKDCIYREIGDQLENDKEMLNFFLINIKTKHYFILYNNDEGKWYDRTLRLINLQVINKGMGFKELYKDEESYAAAQAKAFKAEQENRKMINDREHFRSALLESTSKVFIPLTTNQDKSLQQEQKIVKEITDLSNYLKAIKEEPKVDEPKVDEQTKEVEK